MTDQAEHSATLGALAKALAGAQAKLEDAKKDRTNPHFNSRYATLASVRAAMSDVLPAFGLAVVQGFEPMGDGGVCVVTTLLHESGEWVRSRLFIPVTKKDAQGFGSALTYARRYSLAAIVGIATDDDDDANTASKPPSPERRPAPVRAAPVPDANPVAEVYVGAIDKAEDTTALMAAYTALQADPALPAAAKTYLVSLCTAKRRKLEGKAA